MDSSTIIVFGIIAFVVFYITSFVYVLNKLCVIALNLLRMFILYTRFFDNEVIFDKPLIIFLMIMEFIIVMYFFGPKAFQDTRSYQPLFLTNGLGSFVYIGKILIHGNSEGENFANCVFVSILASLVVGAIYYFAFMKFNIPLNTLCIVNFIWCIIMVLDNFLEFIVHIKN